MYHRGGAIELPRPLYLRPILSPVSFFSFLFFFATWKSDGRANNNGEKSWTRSRDNKNLYDKDFFIRLERWDKSFVRKKKGKGNRNVAKFPVNNKFINERIDITISMADKSSDGYLFSFSRGIIRS